VILNRVFIDVDVAVDVAVVVVAAIVDRLERVRSSSDVIDSSHLCAVSESKALLSCLCLKKNQQQGLDQQIANFFATNKELKNVSAASFRPTGCELETIR